VALPAPSRSSRAGAAPENEEQRSVLYAAFMSLIVKKDCHRNVATLVDGNPDNNFEGEATLNPNGV
jgi:hypothetical protein